MKTLKLLFTITALLMVTNSHAQFLKKLKKKATEAAERTIERKVEEKSEKEDREKRISTLKEREKRSYENGSRIYIQS